MFAAHVYRIMIGCPGDVAKEVQIAQYVINRWTNLHAEQNGIVLLPIHWKTNSYPEQGAHPQTILNKQLVNKSDMLIGIFGSRIGSPTDNAKSGTISEIEEHIKSGKPVMLFFRKINDTSHTSPTDFADLEAFKGEMKSRGLYHEFNTTNDFEKTITDALELFLADHWQKEAPKPQSKAVVEFSDTELELLKNWVKSDNPEAHFVRYKNGVLYVVGSKQIEVTEAYKLIELKDFFTRLEKNGLIAVDRYNRQGNPVYQLRKPAYNLIDSLEN